MQDFRSIGDGSGTVTAVEEIEVDTTLDRKLGTSRADSASTADEEHFETHDSLQCGTLRAQELAARVAFSPMLLRHVHRYLHDISRLPASGIRRPHEWRDIVDRIGVFGVCLQYVV